MTRRFGALLLFASLLLLSLNAFGQGSTASVTGRVVDPQKAVINDAKVIAKNVDTGVEVTTATTGEGVYSFAALPAGVYDIRVEKEGFGGAQAKAVKLQVGDRRDLNFNLSVSTTSVVEVTEELPLIQTTKTDVSTVVTDLDMARLPVQNSAGGAGGSSINDFASLALGAPGVRQDQTGNNLDLVGPGSYNDRGNLINIDGGNVIDQVVSTRDAIGASVDEIKEFQVLTNNYNAEYGQAGGLIINAVTKSGTNAIHGNFHFLARGRNLSAGSYFYNLGQPADIARAAFTKHEYGFTLGGPIIKDKTFWFVSYEKLLIPGSPLTLTPPTGAVTVSQPDDEVLWSAKIDHHITTNHLFTIRFNAQRLTQDNQLVQIPTNASPDALVSNFVHDHTLNMGLTSTLTPHLVNEARVFWHRFVGGLADHSDLPGLQGPDFYMHAPFCCPQGAPAPGQNRYDGRDNLSWVHGAHSFKFGASMSYYPYVSQFAQSIEGVWTHGFNYGVSPPTAPGGANPPTLFTIAVGGPGFTGIPGFVSTKDNIYAWYVQDTWKLRSNLTLNYGLRWDYEAGAFKGGTVKGSDGQCFQGNGVIPACSSDKNNFQPRVGIAWSPAFDSGPLGWLFGGPDRSVVTASFGEVTQLAYLNISLDSLDFDGVTALTLSASPAQCPALFPAWPNRPAAVDIDACVAALSTPGSFFFGRVRPISDHLRNPEMRHANFSFERQIGKTMVFEAQYVGAFGFGQFGERDVNFPAVIADPAHPGYFYFGDRPNPDFGPVRTQENSRTSAYNGLIISLQRRMADHVQFQGSYTWSHTIASAEDFYGVSEPGDPRNIRAERADAQLDVRHAVNFSAVFDTEKLVDRDGWRWLFNDWQFGVLTQLQSGRPYPISTGDLYNSSSGFFGIGAETGQRPNVLPDGTLSTAGISGAFGTNYLISENAVAACLVALPLGPCPTQNTFVAPVGASSNGALDIYTGDVVDFQMINGNLGRNAGRTDPYYRTDFSVMRTFVIGERARVELRADMFNVFNRANFQTFNANDDLDFLTVPAFAAGYQNCTTCINPLTGQYIGSGGQVLHLSDLQHGRVSPSLLSPTFGGIGDPGSTDIPRQIQLSIRIKF
jgi:hypothetical protein